MGSLAEPVVASRCPRQYRFSQSTICGRPWGHTAYACGCRAAGQRPRRHGGQGDVLGSSGTYTGRPPCGGAVPEKARRRLGITGQARGPEQADDRVEEPSLQGKGRPRTRLPLTTRWSWRPPLPRRSGSLPQLCLGRPRLWRLNRGVRGLRGTSDRPARSNSACGGSCVDHDPKH